MPVVFRSSELGDAVSMAPRLRAADLLECQGLGVAPQAALAGGLGGIECYSAVSKTTHNVVCMFGLGAQAAGMHPVWLLGTDEMMSSLTYLKAFLRFSKVIVDDWSRDCGALGNIVHSGNAVHIRWLESLQFDIRRDTPYTAPSGHTYFPFTRGAHTDV